MGSSLTSQSALFVEVGVDTLASATVAKRLAGAMAKELDFPAARLAEAELIASELAHNHAIHHTTNGTIRLVGSFVESVPALTITSLDQGPGFIRRIPAFQGEGSGSVGLGIGLKTVKRLSDRIAICSCADGPYGCEPVLALTDYTSVISATLWPHRKPPGTETDIGVDINTLSRPRNGEKVCGDGVFIQHDERFVRVTVADGAGSGREAAKIITKVFHELDTLALFWPPDQVIHALEPGMDSSRGLSIHVSLFDRFTRKLQNATAGNVCAFMYIDGTPYTFTGTQDFADHQRWNTISRFELGPVDQVLAFIYTDGQTPLARLESYCKQDMDAEEPRLTGNNGCNLQSVPAPLWGQAFFNPVCSKRQDTTLVVWKWTSTSKNGCIF